jgi:hypothetical protein
MRRVADQELALRDFHFFFVPYCDSCGRSMIINFLRSDRRQEEGQELKIDHRFISFGGEGELQLPVRPIDETSASHEKKANSFLFH